RSGVLLAVAFVEILPEAWSLNPSTAGWGALAAFAFLFLLGSVAMLDCCPEYLENCSVHLLTGSALAALLLHSLIDGLNLAAAFSAGGLAGAAVGTALALHKLADGFTLTSLLSQNGYARKATLGVLVLASIATPAGCLLGRVGIAAMPAPVLAALLGFAGGSFIYVGAADIVPRLHRRGEDRWELAFFAAGLAVMTALKRGA
ncbi:MAG TPA: ZIP family metal transporter, partial [Elusimicrobiota bacterium]|nr:ZIP family metal transporter [Elusimicrobiota bacterium]